MSHLFLIKSPMSIPDPVYNLQLKNPRTAIYNPFPRSLLSLVYGAFNVCTPFAHAPPAPAHILRVMDIRNTHKNVALQNILDCCSGSKNIYIWIKCGWILEMFGALLSQVAKVSIGWNTKDNWIFLPGSFSSTSQIRRAVTTVITFPI